MATAPIPLSPAQIREHGFENDNMDGSAGAGAVASRSVQLRRIHGLVARTQAVPVADVARQNGLFDRARSAGVLSFSPQASLLFRTSVFRTAATLAATAALVMASRLVPIAQPSIQSYSIAPPPTSSIAAAPPALTTRSVDPLRIPPVAGPAYSTSGLQPSESFVAGLLIDEGLSLTSYLDVGGTWTIGYGHTGLMPDGRPIGPKMTITVEQARELLKADLDVHAQGVRELLGDAPVTQSQFDSLVDFAFNKGLDNFSASTLLQDVLNGGYLAASDEFLRWIYVVERDQKGQVMRDPSGRAVAHVVDGLVNRAGHERDMMRAGFSERVIAYLQRDDQAEMAELRALKLTRPSRLRVSVSSLRSNPAGAQSISQQITRHTANLDRRIERKASLIGALRQESANLAETMRALPAFTSAHVSPAQAAQVIDLQSQIAVLDRIANIHALQLTAARRERSYCLEVDQLVSAVARELPATRSTSQKADKSSQRTPRGQMAGNRTIRGTQPIDRVDPTALAEIQARRDRLMALAKQWRDLAVETPPAGLEALVPASDAETIVVQAEGLNRMLDQRIQRYVDQRDPAAAVDPYRIPPMVRPGQRS